MNSDVISRREFLEKTAAATVVLTLVPSLVLGSKVGKIAPSDKLNIAGIGIGGRGFDVLKNMATENIIALCDVDWKYSDKCFNSFPKAKRYWDWRKMFDEIGKTIDAVVIATPDHTHAIIAANAITLGKHVYCEQPLTHSVYESRLLTKLAEKYNVATQMGNQGSSGNDVRTICEWIWNGEIGEVKKVEAFTDRPIWPQGLNRPKQGTLVPDTLNWDLFIGPAPMRPYHETYTPWNWRGWWNFGTGAWGDMACHILHPVFKALKLKYPIKAQGSSTSLMADCTPNAEMVRIVFPERQAGGKIKFPEVEVIWYDGGLQPLKPQGWPAGKNMNNAGGGVLFHGTRDTLICGCYGKGPWLLSGRVPDVPKTLHRITEEKHELDWVRACKESPQNSVETSSPFSEAGPFNEMVVMGTLAVRLQGLNRELEWDGKNMRFTNIPDEEIKICTEDRFSMQDGHPIFEKKWGDPINAQQFARELIKHTYRQGWSLPEMPD